MNGTKIIGMLSFTDLLKISIADTLNENEEVIDVSVYDVFTIQQVMAKNLVCIAPETTIKEAAEILATREFHALPVTKDDNLVGILTTTDLIRYLLDLYNS